MATGDHEGKVRLVFIEASGERQVDIRIDKG